MKKILAIVALATSMSAFAGEAVLVEYGFNRTTTGVESATPSLVYKRDVTSQLAVDVGMNSTQTETNSLSDRYEIGLTGTQPLFSTIKGYGRVALGQKSTNTSAVNYNSTEIGLIAPVGPVSVKAGWRYRSANDTARNDQTHTARLTVTYPLNKSDALYTRFDRMRGDSNQDTVTVGYARSF